MPYAFTLLMKRFHGYALSQVDFFAGARQQHREVIRLPARGETHEFVSELCDVEREDLPFPDETFAGALCCEVLEHLTTDPVAMLAEIHRVLRPDGWLVLTTPNVASLANVLDLVHGRNIYRPYELAFGPTWRHNREYTPAEVGELLAGCGFSVEHVSVEDIDPRSDRRPLAHRALRWLLRVGYGRDYREQIYVRARRGSRFRWHYPPSLFHHAEMHLSVRRPYVRIGENDSIQLGAGWAPAERIDGHQVRRIEAPEATAYLRTEPERPRLLFEPYQAAPAPRRLSLAVRPHPNESPAPELVREIALEPARWQTASVLLPEAQGAPAIAVEFRSASAGLALRAIHWAK
jgi:SAM-dependent methyltransferase